MKENIVNISSSIMLFCQCFTNEDYDIDYKSDLLDLLNFETNKVVVFMIDGMGWHNLEKLSKLKYFEGYGFYGDTLTTTLPSSTVPATTSFLSGRHPAEHGWLGWNCYYPEIDKIANPFFEPEISNKYRGYKSILERMRKTGIETYEFLREDSIQTLCEKIADICNLPNKGTYRETRDYFYAPERFIYAYYAGLDHAMHKYGVNSTQAENELLEIESNIRWLYNHTVGDTLICITADHGQIDTKPIFIEDYPKIFECLSKPMFLEPRLPGFFIKKGYEKQFEKEFNKAFNNDFILLSAKEAIEQKIFGERKVNSFPLEKSIGDYIAIANGTKALYHFEPQKEYPIGAHGGMTKEEMEIPFIYL